MHAAIHLPRFALQAVLRTRPQAPRAATAVLEVEESPLEKTKADQHRLLHVNAEAERHGVHAGMGAGMALARCAQLVLLHRSAGHEDAAQRELLDCAAQWTPHYETTAPGLCVLDVSHVHGLDRRLEECGRSIHAQLTARRLHARIGFAPCADLAMLAAHAAKPVLIWRDAEMDGATFLRALPVGALSPAPDTAELLRLWGVRTLGELVRLPRQEIALRLGQEGTRLWDLASGGRERLLRLFRPASRYREEMDLEHPVESLEPLLFLFRRMLDTLCLRLAESWLVAAAVLILLRFEDRQEREATLRIAEPTRDAELLLRLLHTHLEGVTAPAGIISVALDLVPVRPAGSQMQIFERGMRDPNRFAETLTQIEAIVGHGNAGRVKLLPSRALDAFEMMAFLDAENSVIKSRSSKVGPKPVAFSSSLPLRRFRPELPVDVMLVDGRPTALHTSTKRLFVAQCSGPWLVSGDWWAEAKWRREIWEVETSGGTLYQLTRHNGEWRLEGVFG